MDKTQQKQVIAANLRKLRKEKGLTQEALAEMAGISHSFYANIERGNKSMSIPVLIDLSAALNVSVDSLIFEEKEGACLHNIEMLLSDKPSVFITSIEKMIRLCIDEFGR